MKKTEYEYAEALMQKHWWGDLTTQECIEHSIIDVTNTIEALDSLSHRVDAYVYDSLNYHKNVLQILKDKLI